MNEMKPWDNPITDGDCHFIAAQFCIINCLRSSIRFLPSATQLSPFLHFPTARKVPVGGSNGVAPAESRRHSKMWHRPEAECTFAQFIHVLAPVQDNVKGIVTAWLRNGITSQTVLCSSRAIVNSSTEGVMLAANKAARDNELRYTAEESSYSSIMTRERANRIRYTEASFSSAARGPRELATTLQNGCSKDDNKK